MHAHRNARSTLSPSKLSKFALIEAHLREGVPLEIYRRHVIQEVQREKDKEQRMQQHQVKWLQQDQVKARQGGADRFAAPAPARAPAPGRSADAYILNEGLLSVVSICYVCEYAR